MSDMAMLSGFQAVVFDLDGTLVVLGMDWEQTRKEMAATAITSFGEDLSEMTVWQMLRSVGGPERGILEGVLRRREIEGAYAAEKLPLADLLPSLRDQSVGVVSLNSRECCRVALESTGLRGYVDALVAREDSEKLKPDPEPLLKCIALLQANVSEAVFIGDRERDRLTARRARVAFINAHKFQ